MLGVILAAVCALYTGALLIGWSLAKHGRLDFTRVIQDRRTFTDPLTRHFQQWSRQQKMAAIRQQQWPRLRLLIFTNNLGAVALVGRTLYGLALLPAVYFTYRQGLTQGALVAQPGMRPRGSFLCVAVLEFGAYLLATALGVNLVVTPVLGGAVGDAVGSLVTFYPVVAAALLCGAWLEVHVLRTRMPAGLQLPPDLDIEALRAKALDMIKRQSGGAA
jgi:hypothetical protein